MMQVSNVELLRVWETGCAQPSVKRACDLARVVCPGVSADEIASLPVGVRDVHLLKLREYVFGNLIHCYVDCPHCHAGLELSFPIDDIRSRSQEFSNEPFIVQCEGYEISVRLPNSYDLAALDITGPDQSGERYIFDRCMLSANHDGKTIHSDEIPDDVMREVSLSMTEKDPQGNVAVQVSCPECSHRWYAPFDIASYLWDELQVWSSRMLRDVHMLASAYGWSESEILNMNPQRRRFYQEMING